MALTQEEQKLKESQEKLEQRIKDFDKLIEEQTLNREKSQAELEKVAKKDVEKREEIKNNLSNIESELKSLNIKKTAVQIAGGLQTSLNDAVKLAGTSLIKTSEEVRTETLERIKQLATTDKGQQKAFELIRESLNEGIILSIDDFSDALGKEGKNFIKTFKTFDKNAKNLDRQQTELARKGLAFEAD